ncbi:MAG: aminotransferase class V-fold PLP-dependent enzyme, partial [Candidatus Omnitrophica bacterium]|nr:aminotransferase class V-fold PLP-dependent enzyme [Candidatus Omnitrophota bacterium]
PGTGKTQLLSVRAASILKNRNVGAENILILTYTNSAAKAMKERLAKVIGLAGYDIDVGTFHSFANSLLQESEEAANYVGDKIQMTEIDQIRAVEHILDHVKSLDEIRPFRAPYTYLGEIIKRIGELKKDGITPEGLKSYLKKGSYTSRLEDKYLRRLRAFAIVYEKYEELKQGENAVFDERGRYDYDDMILFAAEALKNEKDLKERYAEQYLYVMVDEYQDTNGAQLDFLFSFLDSKNPNLLCVGDDDQSIYRFQGASVGNFKFLKERFPKLKTLSLNDNYRSTKELIEVSNSIISLIPLEERMAEKSLKNMKDYRKKEIEFREFTTEAEELVYIVDKAKELKERIGNDAGLSDEEKRHPYNNIAVLVRKRKDILKVIDAFLRAGIPYATDGKEDISGERRVRQMLDILGLASLDPLDAEARDVALYKVLSADYLRIPQIEILKLISSVNAKRKKVEVITILEEFIANPPPKLKHASSVINKFLEDASSKPVHTLIMNYIKEAGIFKYILEEYDEDDILRIREVRALSSFVNMIKSSDLAKPAVRLDEFIAEMKTRQEHDLAVQGELVTLSQEGVRVYTAHGSKGLEFHSVIIPFCLQNKNWPARPLPEKIQLPSDLFKTKEKASEREKLKQLVMQDETRLFYVAMTRAKSNLIFTASPTEDSVSSLYLDGLDIHKDMPEYANEEELIEKSLDVTDLGDPFIGTEEILKDMPAFLRGSDEIKEVHKFNTVFQDPPYRFETGTPSIAEVIGLGAAIDYLNGIGMKEVREHEID